MYVTIKISDRELWRLLMACGDAATKAKDSLNTMEEQLCNIPEGLKERARKEVEETKSLQEKLLRVYGSIRTEKKVVGGN